MRRLTYENLVMVTRPAESGGQEVLTGIKQRGRFAGYKVFPGGGEEGSEPGHEAARRELREETGIALPSDAFQYIGRIIVSDWRKATERYGTIELYHAEVPAETEADPSPELQVDWENVDDPELTAAMPPDVRTWWPYVKDFGPIQRVIFLDWDRELSPDADPYIVVKEPGWGEIFYDDRPDR